MLMDWPSYLDGVRVSPRELILPQIDINGKIVQNVNSWENIHNSSNGDGKNSLCIFRNENDSMLKLNSRDWLLESIVVVTRETQSTTWALIKLQLWEDVERNNSETTRLMFEQADDEHGSSKDSIELEGRNWTLFWSNNFNDKDVKDVMEQACLDTETLLSEISFSWNLQLVQEIKSHIIEFGTQIMFALAKFNREKS